MKDEYLKRQESNPGAILNTDRDGLESYRLRKKALKTQESRINMLEQRMSSIETDLKTILSLLQGKTE